MKIAIVGTGALGGWYAGLLAEAGHEVHCLARSDHETINRDGLTLRHKGTQRIVRVASATPEAASIGPCDLVVVTLKSTSNDALPRLLGPLLGPATLVVTLQNGMGNVEALARLLPAERIVAGLCFVCINRLAPAVIDTTLAGYVRMAAAVGPINPAVESCVALFAAAGVDCQAEASLEAVLWKKLCWNIPFNGLAIAGGSITTDLILADPALNERAYLLMNAECFSAVQLSPPNATASALSSGKNACFLASRFAVANQSAASFSLLISPESSLSARSDCACRHATSYARKATATSSAGGCGRPSGGVVWAAVTFKIRRRKSTTSADPAGRISSSAVPAARPLTT